MSGRYVEVTSLNYYEVFPNKRRIHQLDPLAWYRERWLGDPLDFKWSDRPEFADHKWDGTKDPLWSAWDALACGLDVGIESGTSLGKTYLASVIVFWFLDVYPNSTVVLIAPSYSQLKATLGAELKSKFNKFRLLHPKAQYLESLQVIVDGENFEASKWKAFGKAISIVSGESLNVSTAGVHAENMLHILEEGAGIPHSVYASVEHTSTGPNNLRLAMGNPNSQVDALHEFCKQVGVRHVVVSALDHPNFVLKKDIFHGAVSYESVQRRKGKNGENENTPEYQSRVRGRSPKEDVNSMFRKKWFDDAMALGRDPNFIPDPYGENALGLDVANSIAGDTAAAIYSESNLVTRIFEFQCPDATHLAYNIVYGSDWCEDMGYCTFNLPTLSDADVWTDFVAIDGNGVGSGTVSTLANLGYHVYNVIGGQDKEMIPLDAEGKLLHTFQNIRAQGIWLLADEMRKGEIAFSPDVNPNTIKKLRNEALTIKRKERGGPIQVESKDEIKKLLGGKSPNLFDAFWMWNLRRKDRRFEGAGGVSV